MYVMYSNSSILSCASDSFNTQTNFVNSQKRRLRLLRPKNTPCRQKRDLQPARRNDQKKTPQKSRKIQRNPNKNQNKNSNNPNQFRKNQSQKKRFSTQVPDPEI
ncbi:hypothetical protein E4U49_001357 [Claviceps purpurea]|nr:hypothetical protein E4U49_001357 [Claviceps purpurea]